MTKLAYPLPILTAPDIRRLLRAHKTARLGWQDELLAARLTPVYVPLTVAANLPHRGQFSVAAVRAHMPTKFAVMLFFDDHAKRRYPMLRLNSNHGTHTNMWPSGRPPFSGRHIHRITEYYQRRQDEPGVQVDGFAVTTTRYHDVEQAVEVIAAIANIESQGLIPC